MRRLVFALVLAFALVPGASADASVWTRPVAGPVVRPFEPPTSRFGPGHLGVDFRAAPGTLVWSVAPGTVVFAGTVAGSRHVVVRHANGWRSSYSFLATVWVHEGEQIATDVVGTTGGTGENHDGSVLHLGLRIGDRYVDPMQLFAGPDLTALVHLVPVGPPVPASTERRALLDGLPPDDYPLVDR